MTAREAAVAQAKAWAGNPNAHDEIIELYNRQNPLPRFYRMSIGDDWCAATMTAISVKLGYLDFMPGECSVGQMMEKYQKMGRWVEDDAYIPKPGDLVCYDWQDNGQGDNLGWPDHIGMIIEVNGSNMVVAEGNMAGNVMGKRSLIVNARYIRGYCCPDYEQAGEIDYDPIQGEINALPDWSRPTIQKLVDKGILVGRGDTLDLTDDMIRILVILDRKGIFEGTDGVV